LAIDPVAVRPDAYLEGAQLARVPAKSATQAIRYALSAGRRCGDTSTMVTSRSTGIVELADADGDIESVGHQVLPLSR
jgi:hypothetical protein